MGRFTLAAVCSALALLSSCSSPETAGPDTQRLTAHVEERLPFDDTSFTQGLEVSDDGTIYVGTGQEGESRLYTRTPGGDKLQSTDLDPEFFGEGITLHDGTVWQLTWLHGTAIKRDATTLEETGRANYAGEGWGLCSRADEDELFFSDGTAELRRMDPETFEERERFTVTMDGQPVEGLNELECVGDEVYANVFTTTNILRIDADSGKVTAIIDASGLDNNAAPDPNNVLNGIARIPGTEEFYLAGKRWPDMYRVTFKPESGAK